MKNLTASDRTSLIKLASSLSKGDESRRAILSYLSKNAEFTPPNKPLHVTLRPGVRLTHPSHFKALAPGDEITLSGKPVVVVAYSDGYLTYVDKGKTTRKHLDVRSECWQWGPGELPGIAAVWVGHGSPPKTRRAPSKPSFSLYD